jgi:hypothetical protein
MAFMRILMAYPQKQEAALAYEKVARQCGEAKLLNFDSIEAAAAQELCKL